METSPFTLEEVEALNDLLGVLFEAEEEQANREVESFTSFVLEGVQS